ncbi:transcription factor TCP13 [Manihot esculenta]|uniref:TCP domain-containing protein n=1 Tax=Manihot esculenta TaxID=3983 RepID=A0A2C9WKP4_MANES|nr:transcription factor TCP13 [Manihot esculenta]OAY60203.1 hypothetical protein MANES_01G094200v8 [Manihot esculenta]
MMITSSSKEVDSPTKKEGDTSDGKISNGSSSSTSWLRLKDPRIVRVSRAFGGKDRHSKVCTIRGLRDRRVRLSVPTAIQLYDLQDRLGLNQPSKVVDWLLNAAKHEIDELPPLPMPPVNFGLNHPPILTSSHEFGASQSNKEGFKTNGTINWEDPGGLARPNFWSSDSMLKNKSKEVARDSTHEKENWSKGNDQEDNKLHSSLPGLINNNGIPYGSLFQLEHTNFPLSHLGSHGFAAQTADLHNVNAVSSPSTLSLSPGSQIFVCPSGTAQPYFPSHITAASTEVDPRQINHLQILTSSTQNFFPNTLAPTPYTMTQSARPLHFSATPRLFHSHSSGSHQPDKDQDFHCK